MHKRSRSAICTGTCVRQKILTRDIRIFDLLLFKHSFRLMMYVTLYSKRADGWAD